MDVGSEDTANIALQSLLPVDRTVLAGAASHWEAVIRNDSTRQVAGAKAILRVDDKPTEVDLPDIAPREVARVPLTVPFPGPGSHDVSFRIKDDELPGDNQRWAAVPVKDSLLIRLVDGEPSSEPFGSEVDYLAAPLSIGVGGGSFGPHLCTRAQSRGEDVSLRMGLGLFRTDQSIFNQAAYIRVVVGHAGNAGPADEVQPAIAHMRVVEKAPLQCRSQ